jgi:hypothetical protein
MSNTQTPKRPSLSKKPATKKAVAERQRMLDEARRDIKIDGVIYTVDPANITGLIERRVIREIDQTVIQFTETLDNKAGAYALGVFMWISRLCAGDDVELDEVLGGMGYGSDIEIVDAADAEQTPKA